MGDKKRKRHNSADDSWKQDGIEDLENFDEEEDEDAIPTAMETESLESQGEATLGSDQPSEGSSAQKKRRVVPVEPLGVGLFNVLGEAVGLVVTAFRSVVGWVSKKQAAKK